MNEKESITQIVWDEFINLATQRLEKVGDTNLVNHLSEETFRLDYALSIYKTGINYAKVYCEYPYNKAPSQKLDIFIESGNGYCIEIKFFRPIPSKKNPPFTQHYGALLSDILKLTLLCHKRQDKFLLVITDNKFNNYFVKRGLIREKTKEEYVYKIDLDTLPLTAIKEIRKRLKNIEIPIQSSPKIMVIRYCTIKNYFFYLLGISTH